MSTPCFIQIRLQRICFGGRILVAVACCALMFFSLMPSTAGAQTFTDVAPSDWFSEAVETLVAEGALTGYADGSFRPYEPISRAQFAAMMAGAMHLSPITGSAFGDVGVGDWFAGAVASLCAIDVVQGDAEGRFRPSAEITRQQAASLTMRAVAYRNSLALDGSGPHSSAGVALMTDPAEVAVWLQGFRDRGAIASAHAVTVANAGRLGVMVGFTDGRFYPWIGLTRAQAAAILYRGVLLPLTPVAEPPAAVDAEAAYPTLREGAKGAVVAWVERRLATLSYSPGSVDGTFDAATSAAVMAFQKVEGLERSGKATHAVQAALSSAVPPIPRKTVAGSRTEIDLTRQVLFLVQGGKVTWTIPVATGREGCRTPTGTFAVQRKLPYWRESYLGFLYKPAYFYGGYAIHGSTSVPPYPASHGCVRVTVATMERLYPLLPVGMRVDIYY
jgi:N-acetylmuramoyl-L-alanine amidase